MKKKLIKISIIRDGGTACYIEESVKLSLKTIEDAQNCQKYYLDNRIGSSTKGELFDAYPSDNGAKIVDKFQFVFVQ